MASIAQVSNFTGANSIIHPRRLADGLGVSAVNMRRGSADFRPIRGPLPVVANTPAVSSVVVATTVVEGQPLPFTVTLAWTTVLSHIYSISWGGGTASAGDYTSPPTLTNGVVFTNSNTQIIVPPGVSTFQVIFPTIDDTTVESSETLPLVVGGVSATGTITDNDVASDPPTYVLLNFEELLGQPAFSRVPSNLYAAQGITISAPSPQPYLWNMPPFAAIPVAGVPQGQMFCYIANATMELIIDNPTATRFDALRFCWVGPVRVEVDTDDGDTHEVLPANDTGGVAYDYWNQLPETFRLSRIHSPDPAMWKRFTKVRFVHPGGGALAIDYIELSFTP